MVFGGMPDLSDVNNDSNLQDLNHAQSADILYSHYKDILRSLNLHSNLNVALCTDGAANVSSQNAGVAGKVTQYMLFLPFLVQRC